MSWSPSHHALAGLKVEYMRWHGQTGMPLAACCAPHTLNGLTHFKGLPVSFRSIRSSSSPLCAQGGHGQHISEAEKQAAALDAQAELDAQIAAAGDQISHMKGCMHDTSQIISTLLDMVVAGQPASARGA